MLLVIKSTLMVSLVLFSPFTHPHAIDKMLRSGRVFHKFKFETLENKIYVCVMCVNIYVCVCMYIYIYICIYTHIYVFV